MEGGERRGGPPSRGRILVIGCGFLGGHIARGLAVRGLRVKGLSRSFAPPAAEVLGGAAMIYGDANDALTLRRALVDVDEVVYCVSGLQPASAELDPDLDAKLVLDPLRALVAELQNHPGTGLTYLSSGGAVYGNPDRIPVDEDGPTRPIGAYAASRLLGERIVMTARERGGVCARVLRCANVYGEHQPVGRGQGSVGVFLDRIARGEPIEIFGNGTAVRDYLYVGDLVDVVAELVLRRDAPTLINVGSGTGTSVRELVRLVERAVGCRAVAVPRPGRPFDVDRVTLDIRRLRGLMAFHPMSLPDGIALLAGGALRGSDVAGYRSLAPDPQLSLPS